MHTPFSTSDLGSPTWTCPAAPNVPARGFALATRCPRCGGEVASDDAQVDADADLIRWHRVCARLALAELPALRAALRALVDGFQTGKIIDYSPLFDEYLDACAALTPCADHGALVTPVWADEPPSDRATLSHARAVLLNDLVIFLLTEGWRSTALPGGDQAIFQRAGQPVTVLLPRRPDAPHAASLLMAAIGTLSALADRTPAAFLAMLETDVDTRYAAAAPLLGTLSEEGSA